MSRKASCCEKRSKETHVACKSLSTVGGGESCLLRVSVAAQKGGVSGLDMSGVDGLLTLVHQTPSRPAETLPSLRPLLKRKKDL